MEQSPLNVRGWVSGLNLFMGFFLSLLGLYGVYLAARGLLSGGLSDNAGYVIMALALPLGLVLFRRGLKSFMEND